MTRVPPHSDGEVPASARAEGSGAPVSLSLMTPKAHVNAPWSAYDADTSPDDGGGSAQRRSAQNSLIRLQPSRMLSRSVA